MALQRTSSLTSFFVGVAFLAGAWAMYTYLSLPMAAEAKATESWPSVQGVITHADVSQTESDGTAMYALDITYEFWVDEQAYSGDRISLTSENSRTSNFRSIKKDLKKYAVGSTVTVYYDPELPYNAVLQPGADFWTYFIKYMPLLFALFGLLLLFGVIKKFIILLIALFIGLNKS